MLGYPPGAAPPTTVHAGRYGQQAGGTHPTGMQSCFRFKSTILENGIWGGGGSGVEFRSYLDKLHRHYFRLTIAGKYYDSTYHNTYHESVKTPNVYFEIIGKPRAI